jgi:signal transduction histidine kinase
MAMGATLGVDSAPGSGSVFRLRLPLQSRPVTVDETEEHG